MSVINIHAKWDQFGWIADSPETDFVSTHRSGPRSAAEDVATDHFGRGRFLIKSVVSRRHYVASEKPNTPSLQNSTAPIPAEAA